MLAPTHRPEEARMFVRSIALLGWLISTTVAAQAAPSRIDPPRGPVPNAAPARPGRSVPVDTSAAAPDGARAKTPATQPVTPATATQAPSAGTAAAPSVGASTPTPGVSPSQPLNEPATTSGAQADRTALRDDPQIADEASAPTQVQAGAPAHPSLTSDRLFLPAVVVIGAGSAVLLASLITGLAAHGIYTRLERDCKNDLCPSASQSKLDSGKTLAVVSTVLTGFGIVAIGVGGALLIIAANRSGNADSDSARLRLSPGPTPLGLGATANF
jgi:hypothetical protein